MKTERCREWREALGAYALGHLADDERAGLEAHLEGCPACRAEADGAGRGREPAPPRRPRPLRPGARCRRRSWASGSRRRSTPSGARSGAAGACASASASAAPRPRPPRRCWRSSSSPAATSGEPRAARLLPLAALRGEDRARRWSRRPSAPKSTCTSAASARAPSAGSTCAAGRPRRLRRHLPLPLGRRRLGRAQLRARPLPRQSARRPRGQPDFRRAARQRRHSPAHATPRGGTDVRKTLPAFAALALIAALAIAGCGSSSNSGAQQRELRRRLRLRRRIDHRQPASPRRRRRRGVSRSARAEARQGHGRLEGPHPLLLPQGPGHESACYGGLRTGLAAADDRRRTAGRRRRDGLETGHDRTQRRDDAGHLRRPAALHLRRGQEAGRRQRHRHQRLRRRGTRCSPTARRPSTRGARSACGRRSRVGRARGSRPAAGPRALPAPRPAGPGRRPARRSGSAAWDAWESR